MIVIEGLDGSGKSTQTQLLKKHLQDLGLSLRHIKLPDYDSPSSTLVKMYLAGNFGKNPEAVNAYAASTFYAVDRYANFKNQWESAYNNGTLILADRYTTSNAYYQMVKLKKEQWAEYLMWLEDFEYVKIGIPKPTVVIYLDMPIEISQGLLTNRYNGNEAEKDVHESNIRFLKKCREAALYAAEKLSWRIVDCSNGGVPRSIEDISEDIFSLVKAEVLEND